MCKKRFLGEESLGEKYMGEFLGEYVQEEFLGEESLGEKCIGEKQEESLGEKYNYW